MNKVAIGFVCSAILIASGLFLRWHCGSIQWPAVVNVVGMSDGRPEESWESPTPIYREISLFLVGTGCVTFATTFACWLFTNNNKH